MCWKRRRHETPALLADHAPHHALHRRVAAGAGQHVGPGAVRHAAQFCAAGRRLFAREIPGDPHLHGRARCARHPPRARRLATQPPRPACATARRRAIAVWRRCAGASARKPQEPARHSQLEGRRAGFARAGAAFAIAHRGGTCNCALPAAAGAGDEPQKPVSAPHDAGARAVCAARHPGQRPAQLAGSARRAAALAHHARAGHARERPAMASAHARGRGARRDARPGAVAQPDARPAAIRF